MMAARSRLSGETLPRLAWVGAVLLGFSGNAITDGTLPTVREIGVFSESIREGKAIAQKPRLLIRDIFGVSLGKTTFSEVLARLGNTRVLRLGIDEEAARFVCYRSSAKNAPIAVFFVSNSLDQEDVIDEMAFGEEKEFPLSEQFCTRAGWLSPSSLQTKHLSLGMERKDFKRFVGQISFANDRKVIASYVSKMPLSAKPNGDQPYEVAGVAGFFERGRLVFFRSYAGVGY